MTTLYIATTGSGTFNVQPASTEGGLVVTAVSDTRFKLENVSSSSYPLTITNSPPSPFNWTANSSRFVEPPSVTVTSDDAPVWVEPTPDSGGAGSFDPGVGGTIPGVGTDPGVGGTIPGFGGFFPGGGTTTGDGFTPEAGKQRWDYIDGTSSSHNVTSAIISYIEIYGASDDSYQAIEGLLEISGVTSETFQEAVASAKRILGNKTTMDRLMYELTAPGFNIQLGPDVSTGSAASVYGRYANKYGSSAEAIEVFRNLLLTYNVGESKIDQIMASVNANYPSGYVQGGSSNAPATPATPTVPDNTPSSLASLLEKLSSTSSARDIANAYNAYLTEEGLTDDQATRDATIDFLRGLSIPDAVIEEGYQFYLDNIA